MVVAVNQITAGWEVTEKEEGRDRSVDCYVQIVSHQRKEKESRQRTTRGFFLNGQCVHLIEELA